MTTESLAISSSSKSIFSKIFSYEVPNYSYSIIQQDKETLYFDFSTRTSSRDEIAFNGLFLSQEGTILRDFKIEALRFDDRLGYGVFPRIIWGAYEAEEEALYLYADVWEGVGSRQLIKISIIIYMKTGK